MKKTSSYIRKIRNLFYLWVPVLVFLAIAVPLLLGIGESQEAYVLDTKGTIIAIILTGVVFWNVWDSGRFYEKNKKQIK